MIISGEFLPENVGIPLGEKGGVSYYMLEVHYDNQALHNGEFGVFYLLENLQK